MIILYVDFDSFKRGKDVLLLFLICSLPLVFFLKYFFGDPLNIGLTMLVVFIYSSALMNLLFSLTFLSRFLQFVSGNLFCALSILELFSLLIETLANHVLSMFL